MPVPALLQNALFEDIPVKSLLLIGLVASAWLGALPALAQARVDSAAAESPGTAEARGQDGSEPGRTVDRPSGPRLAPPLPEPGGEKAERPLVDLFDARPEAVTPPKLNLDYFIDEDGDGIGDGRLLRLTPAPEKAPPAARLDPRLELLKQRREELRRKAPFRPHPKRPSRAASPGRERR